MRIDSFERLHVYLKAKLLSLPESEFADGAIGEARLRELLCESLRGEPADGLPGRLGMGEPDFAHWAVLWLTETRALAPLPGQTVKLNF